MRIIDKNHDFYDYLQDPTDNRIVFDRRNSFLLEKERICDKLEFEGFYKGSRNGNYAHLNLQCGAMFWVFLITITEYKITIFSREVPANYDIELLASWKNYNVPSTIIDVYVDGYHNYDHLCYNWRSSNVILQRDKINPEKIKDYFDYSRMGELASTLTVNNYDGKNPKKTYDIPLLKGCGVANLINPVDVFCAIEEHFSRQITAAERTEPLGATNNDKIIMHGFDTKTSFRGKQK